MGDVERKRAYRWVAIGLAMSITGVWGWFRGIPFFDRLFIHERVQGRANLEDAATLYVCNQALCVVTWATGVFIVGRGLRSRRGSDARAGLWWSGFLTGSVGITSTAVALFTWHDLAEWRRSVRWVANTEVERGLWKQLDKTLRLNPWLVDTAWTELSGWDPDQRVYAAAMLSRVEPSDVSVLDTLARGLLPAASHEARSIADRALTGLEPDLLTVAASRSIPNGGMLDRYEAQWTNIVRTRQMLIWSEPLLNHLRSGDSFRRYFAMRRLNPGTCDDPAIIDELIGILKDPSGADRRSARIVLMRLGPFPRPVLDRVVLAMLAVDETLHESQFGTASDVLDILRDRMSTAPPDQRQQLLIAIYQGVVYRFLTEEPQLPESDEWLRARKLVADFAYHAGSDDIESAAVAVDFLADEQRRLVPEFKQRLSPELAWLAEGAELPSVREAASKALQELQPRPSTP